MIHPFYIQNKKERLMVQGNPTRDQITILILGTARSEKQDFFSILNSFSLLMVKGKDERTILNIPAWPLLVALAAFFIVRAIRSRPS
jgi:hypothetical protein